MEEDDTRDTIIAILHTEGIIQTLLWIMDPSMIEIEKHEDLMGRQRKCPTQVVSERGISSKVVYPDMGGCPLHVQYSGISKRRIRDLNMMFCQMFYQIQEETDKQIQDQTSVT